MEDTIMSRPRIRRLGVALALCTLLVNLARPARLGAQSFPVWFFNLSLGVAQQMNTFPPQLRLGRFGSQVACDQFRQDFLQHAEESTGGMSVTPCLMRLAP
jgi:hypothetical protein